MATIDEVYSLLKYRANKAGYNSTISPNDFNLIWPRCERRWFNKLYDNYILSQKISDGLMPFKTDPLTITVDSAGKYTKPLDILHIDSVRYTLSGIQKDVTRVEDDRLATNLSSLYAQPTTEFPIYTEYRSYLQFNPIGLGQATLVYLQKLTDSKWAYTLVGGRPVYNAAGSVQPKWNDSEIDQICYLAMSDMGIAVRDMQLEQIAETKIKTDL